VIRACLLALAIFAATAAEAVAAEPNPRPKPDRLADGQPNWTGFWTPVGGLLDRSLGPGFEAPEPRAGVRNAGARTAGVSTLKSPYRERYEEILAASARGVVLTDPMARCNPAGMPRMMTMIYGMELLQVPGMIAITSEFGPYSRRIWLDGRQHPPQDELDPTYAGHSVGRWEGETLVVETVGFRPDTLIDQSGLMHSDKMRLVERFTEVEPGVLVDEITVIDPVVFEAPWKIVKRYRFRPELSIREYNCFENNRDAGGTED
jgi:hypothetical protein